ncbi:hypothetical protein [Flavobacterium sp.]|uniref:hypothetical protein n=1 Tax=Flavobacterium sp. TaxID=239 RepID=UPI0025BD65C5|nr:hypothetical protein [Flavobacterium sp.]MDP2160377.1 hypothetical protein [Flavobacterium sp.]
MYTVVFYIALFIGLIPLLLLFLKGNAFNWSHLVVPFIWLTAIASAYEFVGTHLLKINTAYWFQLYPLLSFLSLHYFFSRLLKPLYKIAFKISLVLFVIVYGISFFYWSENNKLISSAINRSFITLFVLTFSSVWLKNLFYKLKNLDPFEKIEIPNLWQSEVFYFVAGMAIYYSTTFFLFLSSNFIFDSNMYFYDYWFVNVIATLIFRIFLIIGVWKMKQD